MTAMLITTMLFPSRSEAAPRATEELWKELGVVLDTLTASECANYLTSSGYV